MDEKELKWFDRMGVSRPVHNPHGVFDSPQNPLSERLERLKCTNWRLEGNMLKCDTEHGPFAQRIPPEYICVGTDVNGMPKFKRVDAKNTTEV